MMNSRSQGIEQPVGGHAGDRAESHRSHHGHADSERPAAIPVVSAVAEEETAERRSFPARVWGVVLAAWAALTGVAPHVLHHVGPLAGAAFLAGTGGRLLFAGIALVVSIPFLLRIYRRFDTWVAPAIVLGVMAVTFSLSTFVIGPAISGEGSTPQPVKQPTTEQPALDQHGH